MRYFIDHNIVAPAVADLGGIWDTTDITLAPRTTNVAIETLRTIVTKAVAGHVVLVTSDYGLETLRRTLVRGGSDFEAIDDESALASIKVLRTISIATGGFVSDIQVQASLPSATNLLTAHRGIVRGTVDYEDITVVASVLAALADTGTDETAVLVSNDQGLINCGHVLVRQGVAVLNSARFLRAVKTA